MLAEAPSDLSDSGLESNADRLDRLWRLKACALGSAGWTKIQNVPAGVAIFRSDPFVFKIEACMPCSAPALASCISAPRCCFPPTGILSQHSITLDKVAHNTHNLYYRSAASWPLAPRDCALAVEQRVLGDGTIVFVSTPRDTPPADGAVRATVHLAGLVIAPLKRARRGGRGECRVSLLADFDPKGYIPASIVARILESSAPACIAELQTMASRIDDAPAH